MPPKRNARAAHRNEPNQPPPTTTAEENESPPTTTTADDDDDDGQMLNELSKRYEWLLKPIRDLQQNWDIDIGQCLQDYLDELGHIHITVDANNEPGGGGGGGGQRLNFAQAAIILQGTCAVYGKKIDHLYELCQELVRVLGNQRAARDNHEANGEENGGGGGGGEDAIDFDDELKDLDNIKECRDIDLNEQSDDDVADRLALIRPPMPLSLVPLEDFEKSPLSLTNVAGTVVGRRDDFWMNTAKFHPATGALLLDACNVALIENISAHTFVPVANRSFCGLNIDVSTQGSGCAPDFLSPETPKAPGQRADGMQPMPPMDETTIAGPNNGAGGEEFDDDGGGGGFDHDDDTMPNYDPVMDAAATVAHPPPPLHDFDLAKRLGLLAMEKPSRKRKTRKEALDDARADPWPELELDDGAQVGTSGFRGKATARIKRIRAPTIGVPPADVQGIQSLDTPVADFINDHVFAPPRKLPKDPWKRPASQLIDAYWTERKIRFSSRMQVAVVNASRAVVTRRRSSFEREEEQRAANLSHVLASHFDKDPAEFHDNNEANNDFGGNYDDDDDDFGGGDAADADVPLDEIPGGDGDYAIPDDHAAQGGGGDHQNGEVDYNSLSYEELVRLRLEEILITADRNMVLNDITRRVQEWERKITPALTEDENRRSFDIHEYGGDVLKFFDDEENENEAYDFTQFARTQPQWEVCRYFLSSLMLANTMNVELKTDGADGTTEAIDTLNLALLTRERHHEQLEKEGAFGHE